MTGAMMPGPVATLAPATPSGLWDLVLTAPYVDAAALATAIAEEVVHDPLDARTRLLIRDSLDALRSYWGHARFNAWLAASPVRQRLRTIAAATTGPPGFPYLGHRIMDATRPETVLQYLRELSLSVHRPVRLIVGGAISLILTGALSRQTTDIDIVDEVPADLRSQHELMHRLTARFGLHLAHFQSRYLPTGWDLRLRHFDRYNHLEVVLVDVFDLFVGKLFSAREKDRDDLRALAPLLDRHRVADRFLGTTAALRADEQLRKNAADNWFVLFGSPLPA